MCGLTHCCTPNGRRTIARTPLSPTGAAALVAILVAGAAGLAARRWSRVEVEGESMTPGLRPGDRLLLRPVGRPRVGDVVALPDPRQPTRILVKRVVAVGGTTVEVRGDNAEASTDSRTFGPVPGASLLGRAVYRYAPPPRAGRGPFARRPPQVASPRCPADGQ